MIKCAQCNINIDDKDKSIVGYGINDSKVCKKCFDEISNWSGHGNAGGGWTYREWDEVGAKKYPKIYKEQNFYKKLRKY